MPGVIPFRYENDLPRLNLPLPVDIGFPHISFFPVTREVFESNCGLVAVVEDNIARDLDVGCGVFELDRVEIGYFSDHGESFYLGFG